MKALVAILMLSSIANASPDNEIWIHTLRISPEHPMGYAYRDGNTYLCSCDDGKDCIFYEYPTGYNSATGLSFSSYSPGYAVMYQATYWDNVLQWGVVQCFFPIKMGIQIQMYGTIPFVWLLNLERVGTIIEEEEED